MLTATKATNLKKPGMHADRDGLYLNVTNSGTKSWIYRYQLNGKRREMGLGSYTAYSLAEAREIAAAHRKLQKQGTDPMTRRNSSPNRNGSNRFSDCAEAYIKAHISGWKNPKHIQQWSNTLEQYAYPSAEATFGSTVLRTAVIDGASVVRILTSTAWAVGAENGGSPASIS